MSKVKDQKARRDKSQTSEVRGQRASGNKSTTPEGDLSEGQKSGKERARGYRTQRSFG